MYPWFSGILSAELGAHEGQISRLQGSPYKQSTMYYAFIVHDISAFNNNIRV